MSTSPLLRIAALLAAGGALAACGSPANPAGPAAPGGATVSTKDVAGHGTVLVDPAGHTLYFADQDTANAPKCTADCLHIWLPATGSAPAGVTGVATVHRADTGAEQLTFRGHPLYTFAQDSAAGAVNGDNVTDSFGGTQFTWHAAALTAAPPATSPTTQPTTTTPDTGYGNGY